MRWALLFALLLPTAWAQPLPFEPLKIEELVQDGTGTLWAAGREIGLLTWRGNRWQEQTAAFPRSERSPDEYGPLHEHGGDDFVESLLSDFTSLAAGIHRQRRPPSTELQG